MTDNLPPSEHQDPFAPRKPNWKKWKPAKAAKLWHAAALACDLDPDNYYFLGTDKLSPFQALNYPARFANLLTLAKNSLGGNGMLKPLSIDMDALEESEISLANFATWLASIKHQPPAEFPWLPEDTPTSNFDWPWGRHETDLLRKLAAAATKFWKNYDPGDPSTAPTNMTVSEWLQKQGVAERNAKVMASILRPDGISTGPRK